MAQGVYPLIPYAISKPWGGGHLDVLTERLGKTSGGGANVKSSATPPKNQATEKTGEYVIFSDLRQFPVRVKKNGEEILLSEFWKELYNGSSELPFMLKILSTSEPISLQNHPSDSDVTALGLKGQGKFECWSILEADEQSRAYLGL